MKQQLRITARTFEVKDNDPAKLEQDMLVLSGKAAGVCYMPDNYFEEGIQDETKAAKRAKAIVKSGHHSVFDHGNISFIIAAPKMICMLLNSTNYYATSEKSARYTEMKPETELEIELYHKWIDILEPLIKEDVKDKLPPDRIHKVTMENARYMTSVFVPVIMFYTTSYRQIMLNIHYLQNTAKSARKYYSNDPFWTKLADYCEEIAQLFTETISSTGELAINDSNITKMSEFRFLQDIENMHLKELADQMQISGYMNTKYTDLSDSYTLNYKGSFALLAQAQRHRTIRYQMSKTHTCFYIPEIIRDTEYADEWLSDMKLLSEAGVTPQGQLVSITEQGIFEDFAMKCRERLCSRAQLEICRNTEDLLRAFASSRDNLSLGNNVLLQTMLDDNNKPCVRCAFKGFKCNEPCAYGRTGLIRHA